MPGYWVPPEFKPKTDLNYGIRSVEFTVVISIQHTQVTHRHTATLRLWQLTAFCALRGDAA